eukprot:CAMPEP_0168555306 /NCGR_PEP_ID=MMETSP0413-20121227/8258_1 /TAXON_ID=136452 /ORGANISM="Filamoeba nolandi, Strain NC-AS-23-1" /LENGTH=412 /DNA_ID=CAMNT_0008586135 /DNA_START=29 /DNA_END=1267 /DNA_ORIENTATION=+
MAAPDIPPNSGFVQTHKFPQPGILPPPETLALFIEITLKPDHNQNAVRNAVAYTPLVEKPPYVPSNDVNPQGSQKPSLPEGIITYANRVANKYSPTACYCNVGFSPEYWQILHPSKNSKLPKNVLSFKQKVSLDGKHVFPATGGDIIIQVKSNYYDLLLDIASYTKQILANETKDFKEKYGFVSIDGRNLMGFFDAGSEAKVTQNPTLDVGPICRVHPEKPDKALDLGRIATTFIGEEDPEHFNGTFAISQEFVHDLTAWNKLSDDDQTRAFGRDKATGAFYTKGVNPLDGGLNKELPACHIVRTHIRADDYGHAKLKPEDQNGPSAPIAPLQIYRQAAAFGTANGEKGLYFFAFSRFTQTFDAILDRMLGLNVTWPGSAHEVDTILHFNKAVSGQYWYFPNLHEIAALAHV